MARYLAIVSLIFCLAVPAFTQDSNPASVSTTGGAEPTVILTVPDSSKIVAWRDLRLQYTIVNGTYPAGIGVNSLTISVPSALAVTSGTLGRAPDGSLKVVTSGFQMRLPGERRECSPIELRGKFLKEMRTQLFSLLSYRGEKETVVATLEYVPLDSPDVTYTKTATLELNVTPNPIGIYIGALVGSFLIALLIPISRIALQLKKRDSVDLKWRPEFERFIVRFIRGAIASAIAVLVFQTTSDFSFPISVGVQDFYGGVLLGLLGDKVAEQILTKAGLTDAEQAQQKAAAAKAHG